MLDRVQRRCHAADGPDRPHGRGSLDGLVRPAALARGIRAERSRDKLGPVHARSVQRLQREHVQLRRTSCGSHLEQRDEGLYAPSLAQRGAELRRP